MKHACVLGLASVLLAGCGGGSSGTAPIATPAPAPAASVEGAACSGTALAQSPVNVTALLSKVAPGITVTQITNDRENWNTYADIPEYSAPANVLTYNTFGSLDSVSTANLDGSGAQTISGGAQGDQTYVSVDGKIVYYQGQNPDQTADLYAVALAQSGTCRPTRLTHLSWTPASGSPQNALEISTSSVDPSTGKNVIAYAGDALLHRTLDDGTDLGALALGDPENQNVFHRIRLNPKFPNLLWYKRDAPAPNPSGVAEPEIWVVNLTNPGTVYSLAGSTPVDHNAWSPDGTQIGYHDENGVWYVADVLNADGSFNLVNGTFTSRRIGPPPPFVSAANYCVWAPDGSEFLCTAGGALAGIPIFLMSLDGTQTAFLTATDSTGTIDDGIPKASFLDLQHILFSSDRTGTPEVYVLTGLTGTLSASARLSKPALQRGTPPR